MVLYVLMEYLGIQKNQEECSSKTFQRDLNLKSKAYILCTLYTTIENLVDVV